MAGNELVVKELNNLTKNKLIEIILTKTIPSDIKLSESTRKLVEYGHNSEFMEENNEINEVSEIKYRLKYANNDLECYKRLVAEMERSLSNQQETISTQKSLIKILENNVNTTCAIHSEVERQKSPNPLKNMKNMRESPRKVATSGSCSTTANTLKTTSKNFIDAKMVRNGIKEAQETILTKHIMNESSMKIIDEKTKKDEDWSVVESKRRKSKMVVGTGNENIQTTVKGVPKTIDLHVYRINPGTSPEDLKTVLKPHFPEVVATSIDSRKPEVYSSFKVTIFQENFGKAMDATLWPKNCCVRRFLYLRAKTNLNQASPQQAV